MDLETLGTVKVGMLRALDKANKVGHWLSAVFVFPPHDSNQVGVVASWDNMPIQAITRGMNPEQLPAINQALLTFMAMNGVKTVNVAHHNGLLVAGSQPTDTPKILLPNGFKM